MTYLILMEHPEFFKGVESIESIVLLPGGGPQGLPLV